MILIHGENLLQSREKLDQLIQQLPPSSQIIKLEGKKLTLNQLHQHLRSTGLFAEQKTLILFGILSLPQSDLKRNSSKHLKTFLTPQLFSMKKKMFTPLPSNLLNYLLFFNSNPMFLFLNFLIIFLLNNHLKL